MTKVTQPGKVEFLTQDEFEKRLAVRPRSVGKAERKNLYGQIYDELATAGPQLSLLDELSETRPRAIERQSKLLAPFIHANSRVLEVGGGDGRLAVRMAPSVREYHLVEASRQFLEKLKRPPNVHLIHADQPPFDLPSASIDLAYSCEVLEHLHPEDALDLMREFVRLLVPGGRAIFVTPNRLYGPLDFSRHFGRKPTGLHPREYSYRELVSSLRESGFGPVLVLSGVDRPPRVRSARSYLAAEWLLSLLPGILRRSLPGRLRSVWRTPFRPLEQVVLMGIRPPSAAAASVSGASPKSNLSVRAAERIPVAEPFLHADRERIFNPLTDRSLFPGEPGEKELRRFVGRMGPADTEVHSYLQDRGWIVESGQHGAHRFHLKYVSLESHSTCNQACYFCPVSMEPRPGVRMSWQLYAEIVRQLSEFRDTIEAVFLNQYNEPSTHKKFPQQVRILNQQGLSPAVLSNATGLAPACAESLLEAGGLAFLRVNLSTLDRQRYQADRGHDHLPIVLENLDHLSQHPVSERMEIVVLGEEDARHQQEFDRIRDRFAGTPFQVLRSGINDRASYLRSGQSLARPRRKLAGCEQMGSRPLQHLHILADASCVLCCQDYGAEYVVGNLSRQTVLEVLEGPEISKLRRWTYGFEEAPQDFICRSCVFSRGS